MLKQEIADKIKYFLMIVFTVLLPFNKKLIPAVIAIWTIIWLIEGRFLKKFQQLKLSLPLILLIVFFLIHLLGLFYTQNMKSGWFDIEVKLSLIVMPLIILDNKLILDRRYFNYLLKIFVFSNLIVNMICLGQSLYKYSIKFDWYMLTYYNFSIFHHTSYSSMYLLFSIAIIFYLIFTKDIKTRRSVFLYSLIIVFFLVSLYFISSRSSIIALFVLIMFVIFAYIIKYKKYLVSAIILVLFIGGLITAINVNHRFNEYYHKIGQTINSTLENGFRNSSDERLQAWSVAFDISKQNILLGVGTGDIKDELMLKYKENNMTEHLEKKFNTHNQFVETLLGLGIITFLLLVFILLYITFKKNSILITMFGLIIVMNFIFESMLNTQAGVTFFAFFFVLLVYGFNEKIKSINPHSN